MTSAPVGLSTSAWWLEKGVILHDNKYLVAEDRKTYMCEKARILVIFFGSYRNRSTKHFVKYLNKLYSASGGNLHIYETKLSSHLIVSITIYLLTYF